MRIRFIQVDPDEDDIREVLVEMQKECLPADSLYFPPTGTWWIGYYGLIPVAFCCVSPSQQRPDGCYLGRSGVIPAYRGNGLQRRMIRLRVRWAKRNGYRVVVTDTTDNIPSANNLMACGFKLYMPRIVYGNPRALYWKLDAI